jgi:hypothetical protein
VSGTPYRSCSAERWDIRLEIFGAEIVFIGQLRSLKRHVYRGSSNSEIESVR